MYEEFKGLLLLFRPLSSFFLNVNVFREPDKTNMFFPVYVSAVPAIFFFF